MAQYNKNIVVYDGNIVTAGKGFLLNPQIQKNSEIKFAVISDLHVDVSSQGSAGDFEHALRCIRNRGITNVFCCGDIVTNSDVSNYEIFKNILQQFPEINFYSCKGNHDYNLPDTTWQSYMGETPNYSIVINGYVFILMSIDTDENPSTEPYNSSTVEWLQT